MNNETPPPVAGLDFIACGPQESKSYTYPAADEGFSDLDGTTGNGLVSLGQFPKELRGDVPSHFVPAFRPILAAVGYTGNPANRHQVQVCLVGREMNNPPPDIPPTDFRHKICLHALDPANLISVFFGFNIPVPVDTEAGNGNPWSLQFVTVGKISSSIVSVNWQWGFLDLSSRTHVGAG